MNSKFLTRFLYYLSGFGIGIVMVFTLFQNRACNWTPKNQIRQSLTSRVIVVNEQFSEEAKKRGITKSMILNIMKEGSVDFSSSQKHDEPKAYNLHDKQLKLNFTLPFNSFVSEVSVGFNDNQKISNSKNGFGRLYIFPNQENLVFIDSNAVFSTAYRELGSPRSIDILTALKKNGKIDFSKSDFDLRPRPSHYLICEVKGHKIGMKTIWFGDKINIYSIELIN